MYVLIRFYILIFNYRKISGAATLRFFYACATAPEEKTAALNEAAESTDWIYNAIKKICEDNEK